MKQISGFITLQTMVYIDTILLLNDRYQPHFHLRLGSQILGAQTILVLR